MNGYLLDTNVVSELSNEVPNPAVISFLVEQENFGCHQWSCTNWNTVCNYSLPDNGATGCTPII